MTALLLLRTLLKLVFGADLSPQFKTMALMRFPKYNLDRYLSYKCRWNPINVSRMAAVEPSSFTASLMVWYLSSTKLRILLVDGRKLCDNVFDVFTKNEIDKLLLFIPYKELGRMPLTQIFLQTLQRTECSVDKRQLRASASVRMPNK